MGFFDRFKKKKEDKMDKQLADLKKKQQEMPAQQQESMQNTANEYLAKMSALSSEDPVSAADAMEAARVFDSLAGSMGIKTNMTKTALKQVEFETPDLIEVKVGQGTEDDKNFVFGVDNNYAPVYYCVETKKAYTPSWESLIDMINDTDMFNTVGEDSLSLPSVMTTQVGHATREDLTMVFGVKSDYSPIVFCNELKKCVDFTWKDIHLHAMDESIDTED